MDVSGSSSDARRDGALLAHLQRQVQALRLHQLRLLAVVASVLILLGLVLRLFTSVEDGTTHRTTVLTVPFQVYGDPAGGPAASIVGTGFLGLLLVSIGVLVALGVAVIRRQGSSRRLRLVRLLGMLAIIGSVVACGFACVAWISGTKGNAGGPGPFLLIGGLALAQWIFTCTEWHDLWVDVPPRDRLLAAPRIS